jgi:hypothetical protein
MQYQSLMTSEDNVDEVALGLSTDASGGGGGWLMRELTHCMFLCMGVGEPEVVDAITLI